MKIKSITIVFENCQYLTFKYPSICYLQIYGHQVKFMNYINNISKYQFIDGFELIIPNYAKLHKSNLFPNETFKTRLLNDITKIIVKYDDKSSESFLVKWPKGDETYHSKQKIITTDKGNIYITSYVKNKIKLLKHNEIDFCSHVRKSK